jgi:hypothetical protein
MRYIVTIEVTYDGEDPDPSALLDAVQDRPDLEDILSPHGESVENVEVSVEEKHQRRPVRPEDA